MSFKSVVLGIGIFVVFMFVLGYGIEAFYSSPQYDHFCNGTQYSGPYPVKADGMTNSNCSFSPALQSEQDACIAEGGYPIFQYDNSGCTVGLKECNTCNQKFTEASNQYAKGIFIIALIVGIIVLLVGYLILSVEPVGSALMASGIGAIVYGSARNWVNLSNIWRFLLLLLALVILIWIALRVNKAVSAKKKKKWMFWKK